MTPPETCPDCGRPVTDPSGLAACEWRRLSSHTTPAAATLQVGVRAVLIALGFGLVIWVALWGVGVWLLLFLGTAWSDAGGSGTPIWVVPFLIIAGAGPPALGIWIERRIWAGRRKPR